MEEQVKEGVFIPTENNYLTDYPELRKHAEFKDLTESELKFVFYMYSPHSPFVKNDRNLRFVKSLDMVWSNGHTKDRPIKNIKEIPAKFERAGERMSNVNLTMRSQANMVVKQMFENMKMVSAIDEKRLAAMDMTEKNSYVMMVQRITDGLPNMINAMEEGYGTHPFGKAPEDKKENKNPYTQPARLADQAIELGRKKE